MTPTHESLINHLNNRRNCCFAPSDRYCPEGRELWLEDKAQNVAEYGRDGMAMIRENHPEWAEEIKIRALTLLEVAEERV